MINTSNLTKRSCFLKIRKIIDNKLKLDEIYKDLNNPASKEFEKLLNSQLSKTKIEEGKVIEGKINKISDKFVFLL